MSGRRIRTAFLLVVLAARLAQAQSVADVAKRSGGSVVLVRTFDAAGKPLTLGSGFVGPDGRVVTNAHVLEGAASTEVSGADGSLLLTTQFAEALSVRSDLAVLSAGASTAARLTLAPALPNVGDHVVVIGAPEGLTNTVSDGIVSSVRREGGRTLLQISAPVSHGSSGGPVLDLQGNVVGIAVASIEEGQNLNFAIPVSDLRALLASPAGRYSFPAPSLANAGAVSPQPAQQGTIGASTLPTTPRGPGDYLTSALAMPVRDSAIYGNAGEFRLLFAGCRRATDGSGTAGCIFRLVSHDTDGQTRVFIHGASLLDLNGFGSKAASVVFLNPFHENALPVNWNFGGGTQSAFVLLFGGVPSQGPNGGTLRIKVQVGWTGAAVESVFPDALIP